MARFYDPMTVIERAPEIGELIWLRDRSDRWVQGRITEISSIEERRSPWFMGLFGDEVAALVDHEIWMHAGYLITIECIGVQLWIQQRFSEADRLPPVEQEMFWSSRIARLKEAIKRHRAAPN